MICQLRDAPLGYMLQYRGGILCPLTNSVLMDAPALIHHRHDSTLPDIIASGGDFNGTSEVSDHARTVGLYVSVPRVPDNYFPELGAGQPRGSP